MSSVRQGPATLQDHKSAHVIDKSVKKFLNQEHDLTRVAARIHLSDKRLNASKVRSLPKIPPLSD